MRARWMIVAVLGACMVGACRHDPPPTSAGTAAPVGLPPGQKLLTKSLADRFSQGMNMEDAMALLADAARGTPSESVIATAATQAKLNTLRYDLTIMQGEGFLALHFKDSKVDSVQSAGLP
jgi:hypothetical protein